jgi:hypothetical protein
MTDQKKGASRWQGAHEKSHNAKYTPIKVDGADGSASRTTVTVLAAIRRRFDAIAPRLPKERRERIAASLLRQELKRWEYRP